MLRGVKMIRRIKRKIVHRRPASRVAHRERGGSEHSTQHAQRISKEGPNEGKKSLCTSGNFAHARQQRGQVNEWEWVERVRHNARNGGKEGETHDHQKNSAPTEN